MTRRTARTARQTRRNAKKGFLLALALTATGTTGCDFGSVVQIAGPIIQGVLQMVGTQVQGQNPQAAQGLQTASNVVGMVTTASNGGAGANGSGGNQAGNIIGGILNTASQNTSGGQTGTTGAPSSNGQGGGLPLTDTSGGSVTL